MIKNDRRNQSPQNFAQSNTQSGSRNTQNNQGASMTQIMQPQRNYAQRPHNQPSNGHYQGNQHQQAPQNGRHPSAPRRAPSPARPQQQRSYQSLRNQTIDSNGPEVRIRGTIYQIFDKYASLAREHSMGGDRVLAENMLQHAEHYMRLINDVKAEMALEQRQEQKQSTTFQVPPQTPLPASLPNSLPNTLPSALQSPLNITEDLTKYQPIL